MKRALVYSHDTFGLGNIRRMLAMAEQLLARDPELSVLLVTGSPVAHAFRLPPRLDYIKMPCLTRTDRERYAVKYLGTDIDDAIALRSALLLETVRRYKPDLLLVDKKPAGIRNELRPALEYLRQHAPATRNVLVLRDILDSPDVTRRTWEREGYHAAIQAFYDSVLVLGAPEVFDTAREYAFPASVREKVCYGGYLRRPRGRKTRAEVRHSLGLPDGQPLVLVTAGGGQDGFQVLETYVAALHERRAEMQAHSLVLAGPELPANQRSLLSAAAARVPDVTFVDFLDDMMGYIGASDVVVSMGGYNTVCEILSAERRAIVVPRVRPVEEQWIRAERMARLGLFETIHPDQLTPATLTQAVARQLRAGQAQSRLEQTVDPSSLFHTGEWLTTLLEERLPAPSPLLFPRPVQPIRRRPGIQKASTCP
jgi:predicted glycosyltransferase